LFVDVQGVTAVVAFFFVPRYGSVARRAAPFLVLFFQPLLCFADLEAFQSAFGVFASVGAELSQVFVFGA
jgi:FPC/CPF motif-containing protein YcgG